MQDGKFLADTFCHGDPKLVTEQTMANELRIRLPNDFKVTIPSAYEPSPTPNVPCTGFPQQPPAVQVIYQPPVMYDIRIDNFRAVTQADWDRAERSLKMLHEFLRAVREVENKLPRPGQVWP